MTEVTIGLSHSHSIDEEQLRLELYRLITMYLSASEIVEIGGPHWIEELESEFTDGEVSRILIYTAIQGHPGGTVPLHREMVPDPVDRLGRHLPPR